MNRGDAQRIILTIQIDGSPITQDYASEIELTFNAQSSQNCVQKLLSKGTITWDAEEGKYACVLSQQDTFKMVAGNNSWQLRVMADGMVASTTMGVLKLGNANSTEVLGD